MAFLFVCYFPDEIAFSSILRNELKRFASGAVLSFAKKNLSYHIWRTWYISSYTITAKPIKMLELHYPMIQFLIKINICRVGVLQLQLLSNEMTTKLGAFPRAREVLKDTYFN